ncbi:Gypsy retrotransposon integrase-like protein 1 [Triplophysa tibetana]|uniref:Gypsy retrotransposon integrase-like protein 1 n=1 Tax=Triplophysa tibetana TaxID=1572043 RepID=A0A5A9PR14_9TELE|nr:Gypsy retrotransposon integrase-like protein 1 [Triplophysa tibetana]
MMTQDIEELKRQKTEAESNRAREFAEMLQNSNRTHEESIAMMMEQHREQMLVHTGTIKIAALRQQFPDPQDLDEVVLGFENLANSPIFSKCSQKVGQQAVGDHLKHAPEANVLPIEMSAPLSLPSNATNNAFNLDSKAHNAPSTARGWSPFCQPSSSEDADILMFYNSMLVVILESTKMVDSAMDSLLFYERLQKFLLKREIPDSPSERRKINRSSSNFTIKDDRLFYTGPTKQYFRLVVLSEEEKWSVFADFHNNPGTGNHCGIRGTQNRVIAGYYWSTLIDDVKEWVKEAWEVLGLDLIGPMPETSRSNKYVLTITDLYTKWVIAEPMQSKTAREVAAITTTQLYSFGMVGKIITDRGTEFVNKEQDERTNQNIKRTLRKYVNDNHNDRDLHLHAVVYGINTANQHSPRHRPYFLLFHRQPRLPEVMNACPMGDDFELADPEDDIETRVNEMKRLNETFFPQQSSRNSCGVYMLMKKRSVWMKVHSEDWWERVLLLEFSDPAWRLNFRMSRRSFTRLCGLVEGFFGPRRRDRERFSSSDLRVAIVLYKLGNQFGVHKSTVKKFVYMFCKGMVDGMIRDMIQMPGEEEASDIARRFEEAYFVTKFIMMERLIPLLFFLGLCPITQSLPHQYVLIQEQKTWDDSQAYCRQNYIDLATVRSSEDLTNLQTALQPALTSVWTGRWESRIKRIKALRYQSEKVRNALLEVRNKVADPVAVEANSLAEEIGSFRFQICCVVWCDILSKINITSKLLQSTNTIASGCRRDALSDTCTLSRACAPVTGSFKIRHDTLLTNNNAEDDK